MKNFAGNLPKNFDIDQKNRILIVEAVLLLALLLGGLVFGFHACVSTKASPTQKSSFSTQNFIEAESMMISNKSGDFSCSLQDTRTFVIGKWTNDSHMFVAAKRNGDWVEWLLPQKKPGIYLLSIFLTRAADYGIVQIYVNGKKAGESIDLWDPNNKITPAKAIHLLNIRLTGQRDIMRIQVVGHNPSNVAPYFQFGIDWLEIQPFSPRRPPKTGHS